MDPTEPRLPEEVLLRSRIEIARVLDTLRAARDPVVTYLENGEILLLTHVLELDPDAGTLVVAFGDSKAGNARLFSLRHIKFTCSHGSGHIEFVVANPREFIRDGRPALMLDFPESLIRLQRRRWQRLRVPPERAIICFLEIAPGLTVEGRLVDISVGGFGAILLDADVRLDPGEVVRGARVTQFGRVRFVADIEILNRTTVMVQSCPMQRVGCRFAGPGDALESAMQAFIIDLSSA